MFLTPYLTIVSPQVEVDALWGGPVSPAVARGERHAHDAPAVPRGEPAFLIIAPPAHGLLLLASGNATLPGQAQDVGVATQDGTVFHGCKHVRTIGFTANPRSHPAHRRVLGVQGRAAACSQPRSARTHPQNCIKLLTRHIYHADRLTQQVSGYPRRNSPVCPDSRRQRGWKYPSLKENFPLLQARSLTSWCPSSSDVTDGWKRSGPRARGSSARTGFSCACRHRIRGAAGQSASGIPFRGQRQRHINTISDSEFSTINHDHQHKMISNDVISLNSKPDVSLLAGRNTFLARINGSLISRFTSAFRKIPWNYGKATQNEELKTFFLFSALVHK